MKINPIALYLFVLEFAALFVASAEVRFAGVNLSGAEFGTAGSNAALPGIYSNQYIYPTQAEVRYFQSKGMNTIRLPFRWERLQQTNGAVLDATELSNLNAFVCSATTTGMFVIL